MSIKLEDRERVRAANQARFDALKAPSQRNIMGQFATPQRLALDIAKFTGDLWASRVDRVRFLEPALGTGSFYSALLQTIPHSRWESATGIEIDSALVESARKTWRGHPITVVKGDFTKLEPTGKPVNLIVTNPPYVRHHHMTRATKSRLAKRVRSRLGLSISQLAGLYCYFVLLADEWLDVGGIGVWLIPAEFMDVSYGRTLRYYLTHKVSLLRVHRFDPNKVQFEDALVTSSVVVYRKEPPRKDHAIIISYDGDLTSPSKVQTIKNSVLAGLPRWTSVTFGNHVSVVAKPTHRLSDFFDVRRGLATGDNRFFIITKAEAHERGIPERFLRPILPSPRNIVGDVIESTDEGAPKLTPSLVLIDCCEPEEVVKRDYPGLWSYLEHGKREKVNEKYLAKSRKPWYRQEHRDPAPFLCSYIGRKLEHRAPFRFFWNKSKAVATNAYLLMYPKGELAKALEKDTTLYQRALRSLEEISPQVVSEAGRIYGGGMQKLEPSELGSIPATQLIRELGAVLQLD